MAQFIAVILIAGVLSLSVKGETPSIKCERKWKKVGCFHDRIIPDRPLPMEILNHRDPISKSWDGNLIDWHNWPQSLHALACKCAKMTEALGYKYFGLQFYGECWTGPNENFYRDGTSDKCVGVDYQPCDDKADTECVGKAFTNYIYTLEDDKKTESKIPGGWSAWSHWTPCSAKCNGGERSRERVCNNPEPKNGGAECEGEAEEVNECNNDPCEPVCKRQLEVGIILDASSSVTQVNWNRTIDFVKKFSEEFVVSPAEVHFGVIHFAWGAHLDFKISDKKYWHPEAFQRKVDRLDYTYGGTRTDLALDLAEKKLFCKKCGLRPDVPKLLLVLTDGKSSITSEPMDEASKSLKNDLHVNIISIGVGKNIDEEELREIASDENHVFILDGYEYLKDKINKMLKLACQAKFIK